ncbi:MAG: hypothetical protein HQL82_02380 [Magnetococcales bacterium]|nr:hypothetical protein [Magnetococcales bacterium]
MTSPSKSRSLDCLSNDDNVGFLLLLAGILMFLGVSLWRSDWTVFATILLAPGAVMVLIGSRRLLRSGCKTLLRINHGGATDFRLSTEPLRWEAVRSVRRWGGPLGVVVLELERPGRPFGRETTWSVLLHGVMGLLGVRDAVVILCHLLDSPADTVFASSQGHLTRARQQDHGVAGGEGG